MGPSIRRCVLSCWSSWGISKAVFIRLVLTLGQDDLGQAGLAVAVDSLMILLFTWYLVAARTLSANSSPLAAKVSV